MTSLHLIRLMLASSLLKHSYLPPLPDVHSNVVEEEQANSNPTPDSHQAADDSHVTAKFLHAGRPTSISLMRCRLVIMLSFALLVCLLVLISDQSTVKHARQNIQNDCHQWLSQSFRVAFSVGEPRSAENFVGESRPEQYKSQDKHKDRAVSDQDCYYDNTNTRTTHRKSRMPNYLSNYVLH